MKKDPSLRFNQVTALAIAGFMQTPFKRSDLYEQETDHGNFQLHLPLGDINARYKARTKTHWHILDFERLSRAMRKLQALRYVTVDKTRRNHVYAITKLGKERLYVLYGQQAGLFDEAVSIRDYCIKYERQRRS